MGSHRYGSFRYTTLSGYHVLHCERTPQSRLFSTISREATGAGGRDRCLVHHLDSIPFLEQLSL